MSLSIWTTEVYFRATVLALLVRVSTTALHFYGGRQGVSMKPVVRDMPNQVVCGSFLTFTTKVNFNETLLAFTSNAASELVRCHEVSRETSVGSKPHGAISEKIHDFATRFVVTARDVPFCCSPALWPAAKTITLSGCDCDALHHQKNQEGSLEAEEEHVFSGGRVLAPRPPHWLPPPPTRSQAPQGP